MLAIVVHQVRAKYSLITTKQVYRVHSRNKRVTCLKGQKGIILTDRTVINTNTKGKTSVFNLLKMK